MATTSTIFALSSAPGRAGVAVIRVSGPEAITCLKRMCSRPVADREAALRRLLDPDTSELLDRAVVVFFAAPQSETGEDVVEFQTHGGKAVVAAVLGALARIPGCRMAEAGEFARRAFDNGKLDLVEIEGLADLVEAETDAQRRQALAQSGGALSALYEGWRTLLLQIVALTEAAIDFSDEADVAATSIDLAKSRAQTLQHEIRTHLADGRRGEILRDGFRVVLLGPPNVGKSSLLNALARRDAAIVSEEAGTTRDVIEVRLDLGGFPVIVSDTAGLRDAEGVVESEGIRRSIRAAAEADLVLWLTETGTDPLPDPVSRETPNASRFVVRTKSDLTDGSPADGLAISAKTGAGLEALVATLRDEAQKRIGDHAIPALTQLRHRQALERVSSHLDDFISASGDASAELLAEDLRRAGHALGRITGRVDVEDVLGEIFGRFCIGK